MTAVCLVFTFENILALKFFLLPFFSKKNFKKYFGTKNFHLPSAYSTIFFLKTFWPQVINIVVIRITFWPNYRRIMKTTRRCIKNSILMISVIFKILQNSIVCFLDISLSYFRVQGLIKVVVFLRFYATYFFLFLSRQSSILLCPLCHGGVCTMAMLLSAYFSVFNTF